MVGIYREDAWKYLNDKYYALRDGCARFGIRSAAGARVFYEEHSNETDNMEIMNFVRVLDFIEYSETYLHNNLFEAMRSNTQLQVIDARPAYSKKIEFRNM